MGPATVTAAETYISIIENSGGRAEVTSTQGSIGAIYDLPAGTLYPVVLSRYGKGTVQLCLGYLMNRPMFGDVQVRQALYNRLIEIVGPLTTTTLTGFPGFAVTKLNDPAVRDAFGAFLQSILSAGSDIK